MALALLHLISGGLHPVRADTSKPMNGKKVLFVNSYHPGYPWSDGEQTAAVKTLEDAGVKVLTVFLDANKNQDEQSLLSAGSAAWKSYETFAPDLVIAADDPAQKYFVVPYLKGSTVPVVFCGVNWDASMYGYPVPNVTGMVQKDLVEQAVSLMRTFAKGSRIGYLGPDVKTGAKNCEMYNALFFQDDMKCYLVSSLKEFETAFSRAQEEVDMLLLHNEDGIADWRPEEAQKFIRSHVKIPLAGFHVHFADNSLFTFGMVPQEQGEWAASAALRILGGVKPSEIPLAENVKAHLIVNLKMANAAGIVLPVSLLKTAQVVGR